jgi:hypothetical protein
VKYSFIKEHRNYYKIQELCRVLDISAGSYYKWVAKEKSSKELALEVLDRVYASLHQIKLKNLNDTQ